MKRLNIDFKLLSKIESKFSTTLTLEEERLLSIVISYRKEKDGCYYSNEQLANILKCSERKAGLIKSSLVKKGLIISSTRKGQTSILKPTKQVGTLCQPGSITMQSRLAQDARNTSSKEEEDSNTIPLSSLRDDNVWKEGFERAKTIYKDPKKQEEEAIKYYEFTTQKQIKQK
jgi:hypothetical protein